MINWDEFEHIHVIRKLREVIGKWFSIDVFFADDRGNLKLIEKGKKYECTNKVIGLLLQRDEGFEALADFARETVNELRKTQEKDLVRPFLPNMYTSSFPIVIDNEFMGGVVCVGYFPEGVSDSQKKELAKALAQFNFSGQDIEYAVS